MNPNPPKTLSVSGDISGSGTLEILGNITGSGNLEIAGNISGSSTSTGSFGIARARKFQVNYLSSGGTLSNVIAPYSAYINDATSHTTHTGGDNAPFNGLSIENANTTNDAHASVGFRVATFDSGISAVYGGSTNVGKLAFTMEGNETFVINTSNQISGSATSTGSFGRVEATTVSASHYVGQIGSRYVHSQTSDSTTWAITHNIGHKYPVVTVYDTDDQIMLPETGTATDSDTFTLTFNEAIQGTAILSVGGVGTNAGNNYIHTQSETSTNWRVTHSLSQQYPNITVFDENDEVIIPESITATSDNNADIVFSSDQIGYANFSIGSGIPNISSENSGKFLKVRHDGEGVEWVPTTANVSGSMSVSGSILPDADNHHDLGSAEKRWANLFTGDIELSNEGSEGNEVDGTTGSWTIQEGEDDLYLLNRKNGKKYKFKLQEIE